MVSTATQRQTELVSGPSTRAVVRALELLNAVARSGAEGRLSDLARTTDLPTSTTLRLLRTLEGAHFVRRLDTGHYEPGSELLALGAVIDELPLLRLSQPRLRELVVAVQETANLGVLDEVGDALYLAQVQSPHAICYTGWRGRRIPTTKSALGLALHGRVGKKGFVIRQNVVEVGVTAVAAPVHGPSGDIVAALSISGPSFRFREPAASAAGAALRAATAALSNDLGAR